MATRARVFPRLLYSATGYFGHSFVRPPLRHSALHVAVSLDDLLVHTHIDTAEASCRLGLTIVGGVRDAVVVPRRGRWKTVCARGADPAWSCGPSTSPLGRT